MTEMETVIVHDDIRPLLAPAISLICAILVFLTGKHGFQRRLWSISASTLKFVIVISMLPASLKGTVFVTELIRFSPKITLNFRVDALGMFFGLLCSGLWIATTIYAIGYMKPEHAKVRFFGFFAICVSSTVGIAFAGNLFTLFIFYEMLTIATYPLVIHEETPEAMMAGRKYLVYTLTGGAAILLAIVITFFITDGNISLGENGILSLEQGKSILYIIFVLYVAGFGVKAAIMPLHGWLPSAMVAPTPVTALLHAVAVVKAGAFGIIRVVYNVFGADLVYKLGLGPLLAYVAAITIIGGSIMALLQDNLKKRLAYSTVSQLSYIVLGAALLNVFSITGGIVHLANQAFMKITLFFCAGAIFRRTGKVNISQMEGIGYQMPVTMAAFTIAALAMIGVPPLAGFITKWYLILGSLHAHEVIFIVVLALSGLLNAAYWLPIIYQAFFYKPNDSPVVREAHWTLLVPIVATALGVVALGLLSRIYILPLSLATEAAERFFAR